MVDRLTTREHRFEDGVIVAIKRDEYKNGKGKKVVQQVEEHDITPEEVNDVIDKLVPKEINKLQIEIDKIEKERKEVEKEFKTFGNSREYKEFKKFLNKDSTKKCFEFLSKERAIQSADNQLAEYAKTKEDILNWEHQFRLIKKDIDS